MWPVIAGAAIGALQGSEKKKAARQQALLNAQTAALSPWTGLKPDTTIQDQGSGLGSIAQGALSGYMMGQNIAAAKDAALTNKALTENLQAQTAALKSAPAQARATTMQPAPVAQLSPQNEAILSLGQGPLRPEVAAQEAQQQALARQQAENAQFAQMINPTGTPGMYGSPAWLQMGQPQRQQMAYQGW